MLTRSGSPGFVRVTEWMASGLIGGIFFYAGLIKASDSATFLAALSGWTALGEGGGYVVALALPWVEILAGLLILLPATRRWGALLSSMLFLTFIGALVWALSMGWVVPCGCFGGDGIPSRQKMWEVIIRDAVLLTIAIWLVTRPRKRA